MRKTPLFALLAMAARCVIAQAQTMPILIFEDSQSSPLWKENGDVLSAQGQFEEAIKCYNEAIRLDPNDVAAWYNNGVALDALGNITEANAAFTEAK